MVVRTNTRHDEVDGVTAHIYRGDRCITHGETSVLSILLPCTSYTIIPNRARVAIDALLLPSIG